MSSFRVLVAALAVSAIAVSGCKKNPDPNYIDVAKIESGKQLADTLKQLHLVGMREPLVWERMQASGFKCAERRPNIFRNNALALGDPRLECWYDHRTGLGLNRRRWQVTFVLDTATSRTTDVYAGYMNQDL